MAGCTCRFHVLIPSNQQVYVYVGLSVSNDGRKDLLYDFSATSSTYTATSETEVLTTSASPEVRTFFSVSAILSGRLLDLSSACAANGDNPHSITQMQPSNGLLDVLSNLHGVAKSGPEEWDSALA